MDEETRVAGNRAEPATTVKSYFPSLSDLSATTFVLPR